jgi:purine-binding chemotaxis protein CheW
VRPVKPGNRPAGREIDWADVRKRLAAAVRATDEAIRPSPELAQRVLDERARRLAHQAPAALRPGETFILVSFSISNERYAIEARFVREIVRLVDLTPVPGTHDFLMGLTNLRGEILAVIDLRTFFGLAARSMTDLCRVVVLGEDRNELGVLADQAHAIAEVPANQVLEPPHSAPRIGRAYVRGVTRDALIVLDGAALLGDPRLTIDDQDASRSPDGAAEEE